MGAAPASLVPSADLTASARIRNAALEGFAARGVNATSIRDVASAAGVSPGLVQHHFSTKAGLVDAVNDHVVSLIAKAFADFGDSAGDSFEALGERITAVVGDHRTALFYVARSIVEGDEAALRAFDAFVGIAEARLAGLAGKGLLHPDLDLAWAALQVVALNLGTVLLEAAVSRHLPESFFSPEQLERWNVATTALFRRGLQGPGSPRRRRQRGTGA